MRFPICFLYCLNVTSAIYLTFRSEYRRLRRVRSIRHALLPECGD